MTSQIVRTRKHLRLVIAMAGLYEAVAITTDRVPTISAITWNLREDPIKRWIVGAMWAWLTFHLFSDGEGKTTPQRCVCIN